MFYPCAVFVGDLAVRDNVVHLLKHFPPAKTGQRRRKQKKWDPVFQVKCADARQNRERRVVNHNRTVRVGKYFVIARIHEAEKYIPLDRLCLSPQCGFASCEIGNKLTELEQWNKLKLIKEIAETVWGK